MTEVRQSELVERFLDGRITADEMVELHKMVQRDTALGSDLRGQAEMDALLRARVGGEAVFPEWTGIHAQTFGRTRCDDGVDIRSVWRFRLVAVAATLLVTAGALFLLKQTVLSPGKSNDTGVVATVTEVSGDVRIVAASGVTQNVIGADQILVKSGSGASGAQLTLARGIGQVHVLHETEVNLASRGQDIVMDLRKGEIGVHIVRKPTACSVVTRAGRVQTLGTQYKVRMETDQERIRQYGTEGQTGAVMVVTVKEGHVEVSNPQGRVEARDCQKVVCQEGTAPRLWAGDLHEKPVRSGEKSDKPRRSSSDNFRKNESKEQSEKTGSEEKKRIPEDAKGDLAKPAKVPESRQPEPVHRTGGDRSGDSGER